MMGALGVKGQSNQGMFKKGQSRRPRAIVEAGPRCSGGGEFMTKFVLGGSPWHRRYSQRLQASRLSPWVLLQGDGFSP